MEEVVAVGRDPVVHGVAGDELGVRHFGADVGLQDGIDVGEEEIVGVEIVGGDFGFEGGEDVEVGGEGFGRIEVVDVAAGPVEALAGYMLDACGVDVLGGEDGFVLWEEVVADDTDDTDVGEEACGQGEVGCRATEHALTLAAGGL